MRSLLCVFMLVFSNLIIADYFSLEKAIFASNYDKVKNEVSTSELTYFEKLGLIDIAQEQIIEARNALDLYNIRDLTPEAVGGAAIICELMTLFGCCGILSDAFNQNKWSYRKEDEALAVGFCITSVTLETLFFYGLYKIVSWDKNRIVSRYNNAKKIKALLYQISTV